jgi:hypothetical protein
MPSVIDSGAVTRKEHSPSHATDDSPAGARAGALRTARALHGRSARAEHGVLLIKGGDEAPRRIALREGEVLALDAGRDAPATPTAQLRYLLRLRGAIEFLPGESLSVRFAVSAFRPDVSIRQHIDAQELAHEPLRQRVGSQRIAVFLPPHASALHGEEQAVVQFLREAHTVPELLDEGARSKRWSPLRALRLLVVLEALGSLMIGGPSGEQAAALDLLGLSPLASLDEIKQAYRRLAHAHHPDRHPQADAATQRAHSTRFAELTAAYRLLLRTQPLR